MQLTLLKWVTNNHMQIFKISQLVSEGLQRQI
jgi:hypothetical protein